MIRNIQKYSSSNFYSIFAHKMSTAMANITSDSIENVKSFHEIPRIGRLKTILRFLPKGKYFGLGLNELHREMQKEYGNIVKLPSLFGKPEIIFAYAESDNHTILSNESLMPNRYSFEPLKYFRENLRPDIYGGEYGSIASENGKKWHKIRSIANAVMLPPKTVQHYIEPIDTITKDFINYINLKKNSEISNRDLNLWSLESIAKITLDKRLGFFNDHNNDIKAEKLIDLIRQFFIMCNSFESSPSVWKFYHTKPFKKYMEINNEMINIIMSYVEDAIDNSKTMTNYEIENTNGILQNLLKFDKKVATIMAVDSMTAGVDTTASAMTGILYCLAKNPEKQKKLRNEVLKISSEENEVITNKSLQNFPYLRACIKEGIRLFPPVSGSARKTDRDLTLSGYHIPKGSNIVAWPQLYYKNEEIFPRAKDYLPERWLKESDKTCPHLKQTTKFHFLPFGHGVRSCIGRRFANMEIEVLLINLLRKYKIESSGEELKIFSAFVNVPASDVRFKILKL